MACFHVDVTLGLSSIANYTRSIKFPKNDAHAASDVFFSPDSSFLVATVKGNDYDG